MEPLSAAASVVTIVQLSTQVLRLCNEYRSEVKNAKVDIERFVLEIRTFQDVLQQLQTNADASKLDAMSTISESVRQCSCELEGIKSRLEFGKHHRRMKRWGLRVLRWAFTGPEIDGILNNWKDTNQPST